MQLDMAGLSHEPVEEEVVDPSTLLVLHVEHSLDEEEEQEHPVVESHLVQLVEPAVDE